MNITDFILRCNEAKDSTQLYTLLEKALKDICGYDRVIFSLLSDHPSLGLKAGHGILRNYPEDWMKHYAQRGYDNVDPVRSYGARKVGAFAWDSLVTSVPLSSQQTLCMDECRAAGFYNGAAICLHAPFGERGGIGVANSSQKKPDSAKEEKFKIAMLNVIAHQFYTAFCTLHQSELAIPEIRLTTREAEVLSLIAQGKQDDVIAFELNVTRHAVDFHVRHILKKFGTANRMSAALKAVATGIINIDQTAFVNTTSR